MSFLLWHREGGVRIAATRRVLRASEVPVLEQANDLCERLQALHASEAARVEAACAEARRDGYQAGFAEGCAAAAEEHAARLAALAAAASSQREALAARVAELALEVARKLVGSLADGDRLLALAATAAQAALPGAPLTLLVHPERVESVRAQIASLAGRDMDEPMPVFEVRADGDCDIDACRIETGLGSIDASMDTQLRRLAQAWGVRADSTEPA